MPVPAQVRGIEGDDDQVPCARLDLLLATRAQVGLQRLGRLDPAHLHARLCNRYRPGTGQGPYQVVLCLRPAALPGTATPAGTLWHGPTIPSHPPGNLCAASWPVSGLLSAGARSGGHTLEVHMLASVRSATLVGAEGRPVHVEVQVSSGLPGFRVVGLPDASCREARDRARAAIVSSGFRWPQRRVTVNLAPSSMRKAGSVLDLPLALATLVADGQLPAGALGERAYLGELGLDGSLRPPAGVLALVACLAGTEVVVPAGCVAEAGLVPGVRARHAVDLRQLAGVLNGVASWPSPPPLGEGAPGPAAPDLADVRGQALGRAALEISAAGGHHLLLIGAAGAGKTMLARRLAGVLPSLSDEEALEVARVRSASGAGAPGAIDHRPPFRSPHQGVTAPALVGGGGASLRPGEVSLAHLGALFLDELGEFAPSVLDVLRQPMEEGRVVVSRASGTVVFPARFLLVAAMNGCRCGGDGAAGSCPCPEVVRARYARRISGPLLDRFDLRVRVGRPSVAELLGDRSGRRGESSAAVATRVRRARAAAAGRGARCNAELPASALAEVAPLGPEAHRLLGARLADGSLSPRGLERCWRVALTISDLRGAKGPLSEEAVQQALAMRVAVTPQGPAGRGTAWARG